MIGVLVKGLTAVLTKCLFAIASEEVMKYTLFSVGEAIVKSTKTPKDDEWLDTLKNNY